MVSGYGIDLLGEVRVCQGGAVGTHTEIMEYKKDFHNVFKSSFAKRIRNGALK